MNRLKELRLQNGYPSQADLAKALYVNQTAVSQWERGATTPSYPMLVKLSELYGVTVDYLLGREDERPAAVRIPVYGSVPAGIPLEAIEDVTDWEELPATMCSGDREYFALRVKGDSMWPEYLEGDTVIVRKQPTCQSGDVCVVYVNGYDATLKEVRINEEAGTLTIVPRNQSYPPRTFTRREIAELPVSIAGVVVELRRKVKN